MYISVRVFECFSVQKPQQDESLIPDGKLGRHLWPAGEERGVLYPASDKEPFPRSMWGLNSGTSPSEATNPKAVPPASSQTIALCHSHKPEGSLVLQRHNPDAAGTQFPQFGCSTHWTRGAFFQAERPDDLCIHCLGGMVRLGFFFYPVMERQDLSHICHTASHFPPMLNEETLWKHTLGEGDGCPPVLSLLKILLQSWKKKIPETVCSPDRNPGAIFTFCLKLIQSDLSNANSRERNSPGLLGKVYTHTHIFSLNEIMQVIASVREQLFINNQKHYIHRLARGRNVLSSHL